MSVLVVVYDVVIVVGDCVGLMVLEYFVGVW